MKTRTTLGATAISTLLLLLLATAAAGQVATLRTPGPDADASEPPAEELDGEEAILAFVGCLREHGVDIPDPQFGAEGVRFADPSVLLRIDLRSTEFLDAVEGCQAYLAALQPEVDAEQRAEQNERWLAFAECMRREGVDFPDPDPIAGYTISSLRGPDGELIVDPFSSDFLGASSVCQAEVGLEGPPGAPEGAATP